MTEIPDKFPKVQSPFVREENEYGDYLVTNQVKSEFEWVFDRAKEVDAVEKIHGSNISVKIKDNSVVSVASRMSSRDMKTVNPFSNDKKDHYVIRGVQNSLSRDYLDTNKYDGWVFGEIVGPKFHDNPYDLEENIFMPFDWLRRKATYRSYGKYSVEYKDIKEWFSEDIFSIYESLMHGYQYNETKVSNGSFVEGIIFVHPDVQSINPSDLDTYQSDQYDSTTNKIAKLRRDMFDF